MNLRLFFKHIGLICMLLILSFLFALSDSSFALDSSTANNASLYKDTACILHIDGDRITLKAKEASLKSILEEIGKKMDIAVVVRIPEANRISIQFENKTIEEALKLFHVNYALVTDSKNNGGNIKRVVAVQEGQQAHIVKSTSGKSDKQKEKGLDQELRSKNEPFKFEFDPSKVIEQE